MARSDSRSTGPTLQDATVPDNPSTKVDPSASPAVPAGPAKGAPPQDPSAILHGKKLAIVFAALMLCVLLIALDQTILATALPRIATDFNAFTLQGWVSSAFVLTQTSFVLIFGQVLRVHIAKWVLLGAIFLFELGSLLCGVAGSVYLVIVGRAISGVGAAGIFSAAFQILAQVTLLKDRPKLFGLFGAVFGISSIIGPLIGGGFTDNVTWRWCFYINLPVGGVAAAVVFWFLKPSVPLGIDPKADRSPRGLWRQTLRLDWFGGFLVFAAVTLLAMGLQWGGNTKPWNSGAVISCLVLSGVLFIVLVAWIFYFGERAVVPASVFDSYSIAAIVLFNFCVRFSFFLLVYYIPIFFQATRNHSATKSGLDLLPLLISVVVCVIGCGQVVGRTGRYWPFLVVSPAFMCVGAGLLYTISPSTPTANIIGYQILCGVGVGLSMQNGMLAAQAEYAGRPKLLAQASGCAIAAQFLGGVIGLAVGEAVFSSELRSNLATFAPTAPYELIARSPLNIWTQLDPTLITQVVLAYVKSLDLVYVVCVPAAGISCFTALLIKNINVKKGNQDANKPDAAPAAAASTADATAAASAGPSSSETKKEEGEQTRSVDASEDLEKGTVEGEGATTVPTVEKSGV